MQRVAIERANAQQVPPLMTGLFCLDIATAFSPVDGRARSLQAAEATHQNKVDTLEQQLKDAGEKCERLEQAQKDLQRQHKHVQEQLTAGVSSRAPFACL